ncbi:MAG: serine/threonine-protein phosphatase [Acidobacteria bacterium]|nr:serine/threonine-protein phosphatase [Acidobacteriota bacterium]
MKYENGKTDEYLIALRDEIDNFETIAKQIKPESGELPTLSGIDIYGEIMPHKGPIGGDHIIYVDFNKRYDLDLLIEEANNKKNTGLAKLLEENRTKAGVLVADVSGHRITDAMLAGMLHQAFLLGVIYELEHNGTITNDLFEKINTRFYKSSAVNKFITMIYGEISQTGKFRFISAGHPAPLVFSNEYNKFMEISKDWLMTYPPIGTMPSAIHMDIERHDSIIGQKESYVVNEITLMGKGDILILFTDGLSEHERSDGESYIIARLEKILRDEKSKPVYEIFNIIKEDLLIFAEPEDDISLVLIKKN